MVNSDRHTVTVRYLPYCDELLNDIGATPTFSRLLSRIFTSNPLMAVRLLKTVYFGINSAAQYRLFGHGNKLNMAAATLSRLAAEAGMLSENERKLLEASRVDSGAQVPV